MEVSQAVVGEGLFPASSSFRAAMWSMGALTLSTQTSRVLLDLSFDWRLLAFAIAVNAVLGSLEQALHRRWYRS